MNERIRELMAQAGTDSSGKWMGVEHTERLVSLVVQRCIDCIETYRIPVGNSAAGELACEWTYKALEEIRDEIRETFGFKEE